MVCRYRIEWVARAVPTDSKQDYNIVRPHSALGNLPAAEYADGSGAPEKQPGDAPPYAAGSAPHPVALPSLSGLK